jgi:anti-anti-sigma regulatory factor
MFVQLTQRQIHLGLFGLMTIASTLLLIFVAATPGALLLSRIIATCLVVGFGGLLFAYQRGWEYARPIAVILVTLLMGVGIPEENITQQQTWAALVPPIVALLLTEPVWVAGSAVAIMSIILVRAGGTGVYTSPIELTLYVVIVVGMVLSRLATDTAQRLADLNAQAEQARAQTEQQARQLEQQTRELAQRNADQQRLLDLIAELEAPATQLADGVLFVPIVGHLDSRRAQALTSRLLEDAHIQRAQLIILDIAGVSVVDTGVAQALLNTAHALRLLGCTVFLSGIAAEVATTLVQLGIGLEGVTPVRNPQDALTRFGKMSKSSARFGVDADAGPMV